MNLLLFIQYSPYRFSNNMHELLKLLNNRMAGPASEPLAQLLLRLDFNYWFSSGSN